MIGKCFGWLWIRTTKYSHQLFWNSQSSDDLNTKYIDVARASTIQYYSSAETSGSFLAYAHNPNATRRLLWVYSHTSHQRLAKPVCADSPIFVFASMTCINIQKHKTVETTTTNQKYENKPRSCNQA